jgi:hypothetical protein
MGLIVTIRILKVSGQCSIKKFQCGTSATNQALQATGLFVGLERTIYEPADAPSKFCPTTSSHTRWRRPSYNSIKCKALHLTDPLTMFNYLPSRLYLQV